MPFVRIVRMTIAPNHIDDFLEAFDEAAEQIRTHPGCEHLELWEDMAYANLLTTYSIWRSEEDLASYKETPLFEKTWSKVRGYFAGPPAVENYHTIRRHS